MEEKMTMLDYVAASPACIRKNVADSVKLTQPLVDEYINGGYQNIWVVASGSSSNGSWCARQFVRKHLQCEMKVVTPFTFVNSENDFGPTDLVVTVSQSGYSLNALEAVEVIKEKGRRAIGLTGDLSSDMAKTCDVIADWGVGKETVGCVTKGVTTLALFFMLFALEAAQRKGLKTAEEVAAMKAQLTAAADIHKAVQKTWPQFLEKHYQQICSMTNAYVCGVGAGYGVALEAALKMGESICVPTGAYEVEEYIHGWNLQLTPNYTVFLIDGGVGTERIHQIFEGTLIATPKAFLITNNPAYEGEDKVFYIPCALPEEMTPLCYLPVFQMMSCIITDDLHRWDRHPLMRKMSKAVSSKSPGYVNSPMSKAKRAE